MLAELIIPRRYRAAHLAGLRRFRDSGQAPLLDTVSSSPRSTDPDREFPIELTIARLDTPSSPRLCAFVDDISERRRAERLLRAQHAITRVFAQAQTSDKAMGGLLAALGEAMDWQLGAWWPREEGTDVLRCRSVWASKAAAAQFEQVSLELELARGVASRRVASLCVPVTSMVKAGVPALDEQQKRHSARPVASGA